MSDSRYKVVCSCGERFEAHEEDIAVLPESKGVGDRSRPFLVPYAVCPYCEKLVRMNKDDLSEELLIELCQRYMDPLYLMWAYGFAAHQHDGSFDQSRLVHLSCKHQLHQVSVNKVCVVRHEHDDESESLGAVVLCPSCGKYHDIGNQLNPESWEWLSETGKFCEWGKPNEWRNTFTCGSMNCDAKLTVSADALFVDSLHQSENNDSPGLPEIYYRCTDCKTLNVITSHVYPELKYNLFHDWRMKERQKGRGGFGIELEVMVCDNCNHSFDYPQDMLRISNGEGGPYAYTYCKSCDSEVICPDLHRTNPILWNELLVLLEVLDLLEPIDFEE